MPKIKHKSKIINQIAYKDKLDMEKVVMGKIRTEEIKMKPKWYFVTGSVMVMVSLIGLAIGAVFFTNLTIFLIKKQGPGYGRLNMMLSSFPLWVPILAIVGMFIGIWLLRKYDIFYKKNFPLIAVMFIISIILAAMIIDSSGLNDTWSRHGPMRGFYQQLNIDNEVFPKGQLRGRAHKR